jgi:hypothetical protein
MQFEKIYNDNKNERFSILSAKNNSLHFCYWREHFLQHRPSWPINATFEITFDDRKDLVKNYRGIQIKEMLAVKNSLNNSCEYHRSKIFSQQELTDLLKANELTPLVFIECQFDEFELQRLTVYRQVAFLGCQFNGNARFIASTFDHSVYFSNSTFLRHFSFKKTVVAGSAHFEGVNFAGQGGVSFRGFQAENLYLDFAINGPNDITWLNEMNISGVLSIGGEFKSELQFLNVQDEPGIESSHTIGDIVIGQDLYQAEKANQTIISNKLVINGYKIRSAINIMKTDVEEVSIANLTCKSLNIHDLSTSKDLLIEHCHLSGHASLKLGESSIGRHLKIENNQLDGKISLFGSAVSENSYFENNHCLKETKLDLRKFTSSRFIIEPEIVLNQYAKESLLTPTKFSLIEIESTPQEKSDVYCALKHWLADSGKLDMEDMAFFHMRDNHQLSSLKKLLFGRIFGWGVRLTNLAIFSLLLIFTFALGFNSLLNELSFSKALALSFQSFISSFFGEWQSFNSVGLITTMVTIESIIGILFITVFIGAYIRKLLR